MVTAWADSWSGQRVEEYLGFYSTEFAPTTDLSRAEWEDQRRQRVPRPAWIEVELSGFERTALGAGRFELSFDQIYRSPNYEDQVRKTLTLVWEDGTWKIAAERSDG